MGGLNENCVLNVKNRSHSVTAEVVVPDGGAERRAHQPGRHHRRLEPVPRRRPAGLHVQLLRLAALDRGGARARSRPASTRCGWSSPTTAAGSARAGPRRCTSTASEVASTRVERTHIALFTFDETTDVGRDTGAPVTDDYATGDNAFTGAIRWIRIDLGDDAHDHLIPPELHFDVAMTRQ